VPFAPAEPWLPPALAVAPHVGRMVPEVFYGGGAAPPPCLQRVNSDLAAGDWPHMSMPFNSDDSDGEPVPLYFTEQSLLSNASTEDASPMPCTKPGKHHNVILEAQADSPSRSTTAAFDSRSAHSVVKEFSAELLVKNTFLDIGEPVERPQRPHSAPARPQSTLDDRDRVLCYPEGVKTAAATEGDVPSKVAAATAAAEATEEEAAAKGPEAEEATVAKAGLRVSCAASLQQRRRALSEGVTDLCAKVCQAAEDEASLEVPGKLEQFCHDLEGMQEVLSKLREEVSGAAEGSGAATAAGTWHAAS